MKKFNRLSLLSLLSALIIGVLAACGGNSDNTDSSNGTDSSDASDKKPEFVLEYTDHDAPQGMRTKLIEEVWIPEIEKQTDYRVKVNVNMGGSLFSTSESLAGIENGIADMGMVAGEPYPDKLFGNEIFSLFPKSAKTWESLNEIYTEAFEKIPILQEEGIEKYNQKLLFAVSPSPLAFGATYEIDSLADLKGKKWRAANKRHLEMLGNTGAETVSVPWEDVYTSLQTNVIDGVLTNYDGFDKMKFYESAPNILVAPELWYATPHMHTINLDTWNSLPEDIQEGILRATDIAREKFGEIYNGIVEEIVERQLEDGINVKVIEGNELDSFVEDEFVNKMRADWVKELNDLHGDPNGEKYLETLEEIIERARSNE